MFLGWDCANKTLAWSHIKIDLHILSKLEAETMQMLAQINDWCGFNVLKDFDKPMADKFHEFMINHVMAINEWLDRLQKIMDGFIYYNSIGVADVLAGRKVKDVTEIDRVKLLKNYLTTKHPAENLEPGITVIIERQNKIASITNAQSTAVSYQLAFYYAENNPIFIDPKNKGKLVLGPGLILERFIAEEIPKYKDIRAAKYSARKKHAKANLLYLLDAFGQRNVLDGISKSLYDDAADSTMEILAYVQINGLLR